MVENTKLVFNIVSYSVLLYRHSELIVFSIFLGSLMVSYFVLLSLLSNKITNEKQEIYIMFSFSENIHYFIQYKLHWNILKNIYYILIVLYLEYILILFLFISSDLFASLLNSYSFI